MTRTIARRAPSILLLLSVAGCPPDLGGFELVDTIGPGADAGPRTPSEPDFGTPCTDPYVAMTVQDRSSTSAGQVRRFALPSLDPCRDTELSRSHPAFGSAVYAVTGLPDGTEALGVDGSVLALDAEGFPRWRVQLDRPGGFHPLELFVLNGDRLAVGYWSSGTTAEGLLLLDLDGGVVHEWTEGLSGANSFAPDPAMAGSLLVSRYGDVDRVAADTTGPRLADGTELLPRSDTAGSLITMDTDPATGHVVIAYQQAIVIFTPSAGSTMGPFTCGPPCDTFHAATFDPTDPSAALALCNDAGGSARHLVRVRPSGTCDVAFDGTFLESGLPTEVSIIGG